MPPTPKIHILGLGNLGRLFAHALATSPHPPPITLLFHRSSLLEDWETAGRRIEIASKDLTSTPSSSNYSIEVVDPNIPTDNEEIKSHPTPEPILNLIVTTKTLHTIRALTPLLPRLNQQSTLLFAQNGMGTIEEVTTALFSNPSTRPRYLAAITSHGVYSTGPFRSVHAGLANVTIGPVYPQSLSPESPAISTSNSQPGLEDSNPDAEAEQTAPLLNALTSSPLLSATSVTAPRLKYLQLEKLTINAILNPLTAILHIKNGEILEHSPVRKLMRVLVEECSQILLSLPELQPTSTITITSASPSSSTPSSTPNSKEEDEEDMTLEERFSPSRLESLVVNVAQKTAANTSSMLQDVQKGRETEIEYINGYFVKRARESGVKCEMNERIAGMVREEVRLGVGDLEEWFPGVGR